MVVSMYAKRMPVRRIAKHIGRSYSAVRRRVETMGVHRDYVVGVRPRGDTPLHSSRRTWTDDETATMVHMYKRGFSLASIAKKLDRGTRAVCAKARRLGINFSAYDVTMTPAEVTALIGIDKSSLTYRCMNVDNPIPHRRVGRFYDFDYAEVYEWLEAGNVLCFDRAKLDPTLHRMYDDWRRRTLTSAEICEACHPIYDILTRDATAKERIALGPNHQVFYDRMAVYELAYQRGHTIPTYARGDFLAVRTAWLTEYVYRKDVEVAYGQTMLTYHLQKLTGTAPGRYVRRADLVEVLRKRGMDSEVKHWQSVPIPWQELMSDYERTKR